MIYVEADGGGMFCSLNGLSVEQLLIWTQPPPTFRGAYGAFNAPLHVFSRGSRTMTYVKQVWLCYDFHKR